MPSRRDRDPNDRADPAAAETAPIPTVDPATVDDDDPEDDPEDGDAPEGDPEVDDASGLFDDPEKAAVAQLIKDGEFEKAHEMIGAIIEKSGEEETADDVVLMLEEDPETVEVFDGNADDLREIVRDAIGHVMTQHTGRLPD